MVFVVDDLAILIGAIMAGSAVTGGALLGAAYGKGKVKYFNQNGKKVKVVLDGPVPGVDSKDTIGHNSQGFPVDKNGYRITSDGPLERLNISSYDAVDFAKTYLDSTYNIVNKSGDIQALLHTSNPAQLKQLYETITKDSKWIETLIDNSIGDLDLTNQSPAIIKGLIGHPNKIIDLIHTQGNASKLLDKLKKYDPTITINTKRPKEDITAILNTLRPDPNTDGILPVGIPDYLVPGGTTKKGGSTKGGGTGVGPVKIPDDILPGGKTKKGTNTGTSTGTTTGGGTATKPKPKPNPDPDPYPYPYPTPRDPTPRDPESPKRRRPDDDDKRKPIPGIPGSDDSGITEKKIDPNQNPSQWYPQKNLGGQDALRINALEKLQELREYTLFDLVRPILTSDPDNLLALQNAMKEKERFFNTYPNPPSPPPERPIPNTDHWQHPMVNTMPVPYPMRYGSYYEPHMYDRWGYQDRKYVSAKQDMLSQQHEHCDLAYVLNTNKTKGFTAVPEIQPNQSFSLLNDIDSSKITQEDLMLVR